MRVVLAEDSVLLRQGLVALLTEHPAVDEVIEAGDLGELLDAVSEQEPDVVLADIRMPPTHTDEGIRAAERFRRTHPKLGVVVLSQHADAEGALALVAGGSTGRGYLLKERVADVEHLVVGARGGAPRGERHRPARRRRPDAAPPAVRGQPGRAAHQPRAGGARPDRHGGVELVDRARRCTSPPGRSRSTSTRSSPSSTCPPATAPTVGSRPCCSTSATAGPTPGRWRPGRWSDVARPRAGWPARARPASPHRQAAAARLPRGSTSSRSGRSVAGPGRAACWSSAPRARSSATSPRCVACGILLLAAELLASRDRGALRRRRSRHRRDLDRWRSPSPG